MVAENTKNGWVFISRGQGLFTKRLHLTVPTRTALQKGQIEQLWRESRLSLRNPSSTKGYGWILWKRSCTSKIAAQQPQSPLHHTNPGTASSPTSRISESSDQWRMSMFQRKGARNSTPTRTRGS